jgi:hypothetical protein
VDITEEQLAKLASAEVTLATLRDWAQRMAALPGESEHAKGFNRAVGDVLTILDSRELPPGAPVVFPA